MSKDHELVLCVPSEVFGPLEGYESLNRLGFNATQSNPRVKRLRKYFAENRPLWKRRGTVETNEAFQQLIPYVVVTFSNRELFSYRRAPAKKPGERRLLGKRSIGIGGHINPCDVKETMEREMVSKDLFRDLLYAAALREMQEELQPDRELNPRNLTARAFVRTAEAPVAKVHVGVVFEYQFRIGGKYPVFDTAPEIADVRFSGVADVRADESKLEQWSKEIIPFLRKDFNIA